MVLHIQNTIVCPKIEVRGHYCDRTPRKQCTEENTLKPNYTACPLFHNGFCTSLVVSLLLSFYCELLVTAVTECKETAKPPVTEGNRNPATYLCVVKIEHMMCDEVRQYGV